MQQGVRRLVVFVLAAVAAGSVVSSVEAADGTRVAARKHELAARQAAAIAIVISGDSVIAGPARDAIGAVAREQGFRVIPANGRGPESEPGAYARKADAVFYVEANPVGATEVEYYGNVSMLYSVEFSLSAYRTRDGELLWELPAQSIDFTALNADEKAREAVAPLLADIEQELRRIR
ncbi:MAG: hypothetical protein JNN30_22455 [Rhodanobacteraceae bacterium]|nr:hypothetical protein [Rhodanobacteraceae bacterium]